MKTSVASYVKSLLSTALTYCKEPGTHPTPLPELTVIRRDQVSDTMHGMYNPSVCFVLQGEKTLWTGNKVYHYNPSNYLVTCIDVPATAQVVKASPGRPFVTLKLDLKASIVYEILQNTSPDKIRKAEPKGAFHVEKVTVELADAFVRLLKAVGDADDLKVLAPYIVREIHYRLMDSRFGTKIRQLGVVGSRTQKIGKVIDHLRKDFAAPLKVTDLAKMANMSPSAFHLHFRQVTNMSPLQYQKQIRLQEARRLLSLETLDAASVAYQVGYESPSQFSREYRRLFGQPPMRDMDRMKAMISVAD